VSAQDDNRRAIYEQDMESIRYRHAAKWSRFQTVSAIEGAALYASFRGGLTTTESVLVMALATLLLTVVFLFVSMDDRMMLAYHERVHEFELSANKPLSGPSFGLFYRINPTRILTLGILAFNAAAIVRLVYWPVGL
jgi:hypothetical protein